MKIYPKHFYVIVPSCGKGRDGAYRIKPTVNNKTKKSCSNKCGYAVVGKTAATNPDGYEYCSQKKQAHVRTDRCARIYSVLTGKPLNTKIIHNGWQYGDEDYDQAGDIFSGY